MAGPQLNFKKRLEYFVRAFGALFVIVALVKGFEHFLDAPVQDNALFGLGFLLVVGIFGGQIAALVNLPKLTGYLLAGLAAGPSVLGAINESQVHDLKVVNLLALALIGLHAGCEFTKEMLQKNLRLLSIGTLFHLIIIGGGMSAVFYFLFRTYPSMAAMSVGAVLMASVVFAVICTSKSPAVVVAVLAETKSRGPLSEYALGMVVFLDIVVLIVFSFCLALAQSEIAGIGQGLALPDMIHLGEEILISVGAGVFFGVILILYLWLINREIILFLTVIAYAVTAICQYLHYDTMLVFVVAGVMVTQFSRQGHKMIMNIENLSSVVMVVFFATAGASLHLEELRTLWPFAVAAFFLRAILTFGSEHAAHRLAKSPLELRRYGSTAFISQAGLTIGLATVLSDKLPKVGVELATLAIAVVTLNEVFGPIIFKWGLARAGEIEPVEAKPVH